MKSFFIHTYGCQMNAHESDRLAYMLSAAGLVRVANAQTADIVIFQTCSIRDTAARKVLMHISQAVRAREKYHAEHARDTGYVRQTLCVIGCLSATEKIAGVDIVLGTNKLEELVEKLTAQKPDPRFGVETSIIIMYGCENFCTYCIVPYARGLEKSRPIDDIVQEFKQIARRGGREASGGLASVETGCQSEPSESQTKNKYSKSNNGNLNLAVAQSATRVSQTRLPCPPDARTPSRPIYLLGQNVNSYRCPKTGVGFVGLLDKLCEIARGSGVLINFMSSHPKDFSRELVDCIARNPEIERNIHLPMQSGCDKILRKMNRGYTVGEYLEKIDLLRRAVPDVRITTDIICGFPTETDADFLETVEIVRRVRFNAAFIFPYSRRNGTQADKMDGQIDPKTIKARTTQLIAIQRGINA